MEPRKNVAGERVVGKLVCYTETEIGKGSYGRVFVGKFEAIPGVFQKVARF